MEMERVVQSLAALGQPVRLELLRALVAAGPSGMTPSTMAEGGGIAPATLSFHLKELAHAGLVSYSREGRHLIYHAEDRHMGELLAYLGEHCCQGTAHRRGMAPRESPRVAA